MKKVIIVILLFLGFSIQAQQEELTSETWYLTKVVDDGIEYYAPEPWENFTNATLYFSFWEEELSLHANICSHVVYMIVDTLDNQNFSCEYQDDTMSICAPDIPYYREFEGIYLNFWRNYSESTARDPFVYEITEENGILALVVTNNEGGKVYYYNQDMMSVNYFSRERIKYYPNPVKDKLVIENPDLKITSISISDVSGKIVFSSREINSDKIEVDFSSFPKGVYFLTTELDGKILKTEKVLKK